MEPIKIPARNVTELEKEILSRLRNARGIIPHVIKLYYRAVVTKTAWCWHKKETYHWNRRENPEINLHRYRHLIFEKGVKETFIGGKENPFINKWCCLPKE